MVKHMMSLAWASVEELETLLPWLSRARSSELFTCLVRSFARNLMQKVYIILCSKPEAFDLDNEDAYLIPRIKRQKKGIPIRTNFLPAYEHARNLENNNYQSKGENSTNLLKNTFLRKKKSKLKYVNLNISTLYPKGSMSMAYTVSWHSFAVGFQLCLLFVYSLFMR
ncbi:hypothetical protein BD560DRAFT_491898 [Blakeslea trispora]|nr:hypothetical protein BD560DRAFT_491898 [Blakeslea trispora]